MKDGAGLPFKARFKYLCHIFYFFCVKTFQEALVSSLPYSALITLLYYLSSSPSSLFLSFPAISSAG